jgi:hypothetical protein
MRTRTKQFGLAFALCVLLAFCVLSLRANALPVKPATNVPDYSKTASWVCKPGSEDVCTTGLDAVVVSADGTKTVQHFEPAKKPEIDCFYVYPTVSEEQSPNADMTDSPEIQRAVKDQVGRLSSRCRVFAPIYRQTTLYGLRQNLSGAGNTDFSLPMTDVYAAWTYYLEHDNQGRGVVLVGHSQGTILLQKLIEVAIDGKPSQSLLVSAFLAGDPSLGVPPGKTVGGTFKHVPVCSSAAQTGCVYVWGTFRADDTSTNRIFGGARHDGLMSACANPAAPDGGTGKLESYFQRPATSPESDPPWIETT